LADHGAEVVKVERKNPRPLGNRKLGLQCDLHRDKISVALNMQHPRGVEIARRIAAISDVVMDNFSARVMRTWGMDYESLRAVKPDIICISMSGLGHTGPLSSYVSYGPTLQALTGYTLLMAERDGTPAGYGYSYADMCGGYTGALAALVALYNRRRTGQGQFVDLSQFEAVAAAIGPALLDISVNGRIQSPPGYNSQEGPAAPHGVYKCKALAGDDDRWAAIGVHSEAEWRRFVTAIARGTKDGLEVVHRPRQEEHEHDQQHPRRPHNHGGQQRQRRDEDPGLRWNGDPAFPRDIDSRFADQLCTVRSVEQDIASL
jgi:crotonobetainyl-CoA:carnitine CoA-transferase CaiB-like acyl-CoA transferase